MSEREREKERRKEKREREKEREIIHQPRRFHPSGGMRQEGEKKGKGIEKNTARLPAMLSKNAENFQRDKLLRVTLFLLLYQPLASLVPTSLTIKTRRMPFSLYLSPARDDDEVFAFETRDQFEAWHREISTFFSPTEKFENSKSFD